VKLNRAAASWPAVTRQFELSAVATSKPLLADGTVQLISIIMHSRLQGWSALYRYTKGARGAKPPVRGLAPFTALSPQTEIFAECKWTPRMKI